MAETDEQVSKYISVVDAAADIGVNRSTLYYYMKQVDPRVETIKFPLDKTKYILKTDHQRIKAAKQAAREKKH